MAAVSQMVLMASASGSLARTFSFVGSCVSASSSLDFSALSAGTITAGDLVVYIDIGYGTLSPTAVTPSGFTNHINTPLSSAGDFFRGMVSSKKAVGGEGVITGMNTTQEDKIGLVFRPSTAFTTITAADIASELTSVAPASQNCDPSAETSAVILLGINGVPFGTTGFSTFSPAADAQVANSEDDLRAGYKIYNTGPAATTIAAVEHGTADWLASLYFTVT